MLLRTTAWQDNEPQHSQRWRAALSPSFTSRADCIWAVGRPRAGLGLALGWLDKHMLVDPFSNMTIVAFGQTSGATR